MITHLAISILVVLLLAFELNSVRAALLIGEKIGGASGARQIQDAVTPPLAAKFGLLVQLLFLATIVWSFFVHGWIIGLLWIPGSIIATGIVKALYPSPSGTFFRGIIVRSMMNRYADYRRTGDSVRARAMGNLLERLGYPIPDALRNA